METKVPTLPSVTYTSMHSLRVLLWTTTTYLPTVYCMQGRFTGRVASRWGGARGCDLFHPIPSPPLPSPPNSSHSIPSHRMAHDWKDRWKGGRTHGGGGAVGLSFLGQGSPGGFVRARPFALLQPRLFVMFLLDGCFPGTARKVFAFLSPAAIESVFWG